MRALIRRLGPSVAAALCAGPLLAQDAPNPRGELEGLASLLESAVRRVSQASAEPVFGNESVRGFYVAGYGAMFVVPPRSIPSENRLQALRRERHATEEPPPNTAEYKELEALLGPEEARRQVEQQRLELEARREMARVARERRMHTDAERERELRELEERALAFQREAERARQEAERALDEIAAQVQRRLGLAEPPAAVAGLAGTGSALAAGQGASAGAPAVPPPPPPLHPLAPPWRFWFGTENPEDERSPQRIVGDVREAVTSVLEARGAVLRSLGRSDLVVVAIDFVPRGIFVSGSRPARTLVVRVRMQAVEERQAGRIDSEAFRRRVEYSEY